MSWIQLGETIYGQTSQENLGQNIDINYYGNIISISNTFSTTIYKYFNTKWNKLDSSFMTTNTSLSGDGNTIAIVIPTNLYTNDTLYSVVIYRFIDNDNKFTKIGNEIYIQNTNTNNIHISLNFNGNILVIGTLSEDGSGITTSETNIYNYNNNKWINTLLNTITIADQFIYKVSINNNGNTIVIGNIYKEYENNICNIDIYNYINNTWIKHENTITKIGYITDCNLKISEKSIIFSIQYDTYSDIYIYSNNLLFSNIINVNDIDIKISINTTGDIIAISNPYTNGGITNVYKLVDNEWKQLGIDILGDHYNNTIYNNKNNSLNGLGNIIIVSSYGINDNGYVNVYKLLLDLPCLTIYNKVLTTNGYINVNKLTTDDITIQPDGRLVKILDIIHTTYPNTSEYYPYIVYKNSIAIDYPVNDIIISGKHLIKYKKYWILPNKISTTKFIHNNTKNIDYYHIKLPNYNTDHLIIDGGTIVESYAENTKSNIKTYNLRCKSNFNKKK